MEARPTTYKGIQMRSRTEALYAADLDRLGHDWDYEPMCFADERGQYLPDFVVEKDTKSKIFIEIKGKISELLPILDQMSIVFGSEPSAELLLVEYSTSRTWVGTTEIGGHILWQSSEDEFRRVVCRATAHRVEGGPCPAYDR